MTLISLSPLDLGIAALLVLAMAGCTTALRLQLGRTIIIASARLIVQLMLLGLVLKALFATERLLWVALMALVMLLVGGYEVMARQKRPLKGVWSYGIGTMSMFISCFATVIIALAVIVSPEPWYAPRYAIPLLGMLLGNTMNGISLSLDRLTQTAWQQRAVIEQRLLLGQDRREAILDIARDSLRTGMIPIINAMAAAGIVSIPGMMTGQILAGSPPLEAVRYQIMIWLLIAAGSGFGMMAAIGAASHRLFDHRHRLRLDRLATPKS